MRARFGEENEGTCTNSVVGDGKTEIREVADVIDVVSGVSIASRRAAENLYKTMGGFGYGVRRV